MADMHVYVCDHYGQETDDLDAFIVAVLSGRMVDAYNARYGHFGPKGLMGGDPEPHEPTELADLEPDEGTPVPDAWE